MILTMNVKLYKPITCAIIKPTDHNVLVRMFQLHPQRLNETPEKDKAVIFGVSFLAAIWNVTTAAVMMGIMAMLATLIFGYKHVC